MKKIFYFFLLAVFIFSTNLNPVILGNQVPPPDDDKESSHEQDVRQGSSFYFLAKSEIDKYLSKVEIEGLNTGKEYLKNAEIYLDNSIYWFNIAKEKVMLTNYQKEKYKNFDYDVFFNDPKYHLQTIKKVIKFFKDSDIKGFFGQIIIDLKTIKELIYKIIGSNSVDADDLWKLYRINSNEFGHYGTIVSEKVFKLN